jgi:hypothetical protein
MLVTIHPGANRDEVATTLRGITSKAHSVGNVCRAKCVTTARVREPPQVRTELADLGASVAD